MRKLVAAVAVLALGVTVPVTAEPPSLSMEEFYRSSAEAGDAFAQWSLGVLYAAGDTPGMLQNYAEAVKWYRKSAEQGYAPAQLNLGFMYDNGRGVPQDRVQAHMHYNLAAANADDKELRDKAAKNRDLIAAEMTPAQIAEAQKFAREWKPNQ